jgi:hypothetical protein
MFNIKYLPCILKQSQTIWHCHCYGDCMMYFNRIVLTGFASCLLLTTPAVKADPTIVGTVNLDALNGVYPGLGGGEFTAFTSQNFAQNYYGGATYTSGSQTGFETFCIETRVDFTPNNPPWNGPTYNYSLGNVAQPLSGGGNGSGLALTQGAAWLYQEFATGGLSSYGFDYTYSDASDPNGRMTDDNLLQAAIWAFQGGQTYSGYPSGNNQFYQDAINALGPSAANAYTGTAVQVLQLWTGDGTAAQNQLVYVPDVAQTAGLLGIGLFGIVLLRFRSRRLA